MALRTFMVEAALLQTASWLMRIRIDTSRSARGGRDEYKGGRNSFMQPFGRLGDCF
jgi:hypothetical protein